MKLPLAKFLYLGKFLRRVLITGLFGLLSLPVSADEILIAVASNFAKTAEQIALEFEQNSDHQVTLAFGSSGHHYAQIVNGAPYDIFLSADEDRPRLLEESGHAIAESRFTYASGQLVLWSADRDIESVRSFLVSGDYRYLALANPRFAPYGIAALEVLENSNLLEQTRTKTVQGENVAQTLQFVESGAAQLGFVSLAQVKSLPQERQASVWQIEAELYSPIRQQGVLLSEEPAAREFMMYLQSEPTRQFILSQGYGLE